LQGALIVCFDLSPRNKNEGPQGVPRQSFGHEDRGDRKANNRHPGSAKGVYRVQVFKMLPSGSVLRATIAHHLAFVNNVGRIFSRHEALFFYYISIYYRMARYYRCLADRPLAFGFMHCVIKGAEVEFHIGIKVKCSSQEAR